MRIISGYILCFSLTTSLFAGVVNDGMKCMSLNDKCLMKEFVKINFQWHQMAHTICFENKPVCLASCWKKSPQRRYSDIRWIKGWKSYKKYEHLLPHPNFIFNIQIDKDLVL